MVNGWHSVLSCVTSHVTGALSLSLTHTHTYTQNLTYCPGTQTVLPEQNIYYVVALLTEDPLKHRACTTLAFLCCRDLVHRQ